LTIVILFNEYLYSPESAPGFCWGPWWGCPSSVDPWNSSSTIVCHHNLHNCRQHHHPYNHRGLLRSAVVEVVATQETKVSVTPAGGFAKVSEKCERKSQCISSTRYSDLWLAQNQINQPLINT